MTKLFRKEAIENNAQRLLGDVILLRPISFWVLTITFLVIVVIVLIFLVYGTFARREAVIGFLVPDKGMVRVYAPFSGVVDSKTIIDGQLVQKGDALIKISTQRGLFDDLSVNQQLIGQLNSRQTQLRERIKDEALVFESEKKRLQLSYENLERELYQLSKQMEVQQQQLDLAKGQWQKYQDFKKRDLITEAELVSRNNSYLSAKSNLDVAKRQKIAKQSEKNNIEKQIEQLPLKKNNLLQDLQNTLTQLDERLIELEGSESYAVKASIDGRVTSVQVHPGQTVSPNTSLLTIIPNDTILYAELFLPSRAIGFVREGQKVMLRYDAFPYQRFGLYEGYVEQVAQAVINPSEAGIPLPTLEPVYRVKVSLSSQSVNAYGKKLTLQAGMSISADIILEERSLGEWLLAPIYSLRGKF